MARSASTAHIIYFLVRGGESLAQPSHAPLSGMGISWGSREARTRSREERTPIVGEEEAEKIAKEFTFISIGSGEESEISMRWGKGKYSEGEQT